MSRARRLGVIALLMATAGLIAGCHHEGAAVPGPNDGASLDFTSRATVSIDDNMISPDSVHVRVGDAITVVNNGTREHGLTSKSIDTGELHPGESTVVFLTEAGRIDAYDREHPDRRLTIDVVANGS